MAAVTPTTDRANVSRSGGAAVRYYGTGASNTDATLTTTAVAEHHKQKLSYVSVNYSGAATQSGVTTGITSGISSGYSLTLNTGSSNAQTTVYVPSTPIWIFPGDSWVITALAGGSVTAAIVVVVEEH